VCKQVLRVGCHVMMDVLGMMKYLIEKLKRPLLSGVGNLKHLQNINFGQWQIQGYIYQMYLPEVVVIKILESYNNLKT